VGALVIVFLLVPIAGAGLASLVAAPRWLIPTITAVTFIGGFAVLFWFAAMRRATLRLVDGVLLLERRGQIRLRGAVTGARLARWEETPSGAVGVILHAGDLRVGARDVALAPEDCTAPPGRAHDVVLDQSAFAELLAALGLALRPRTAATFDLERNMVSARGAFYVLVPWLATGGVAALAGVFVQGHQTATVVATTVIIALGLTATMVRASRRRPTGQRLEIDPTHVRLLAGGAPVVEIARAALGIARHNHRYNAGRSGTFTVPVITLTIGTARPLSIGTYDSRSAWPDAPRGPAARLVLGPPDWHRLLTALGLG
jgi:hypothetical protein